ncbi:dnaJ homolog subfamily C member 9-like [Mytilus edulis]
MPGLLESCKKLFKTKDLYKVLSLPKNASPSEVKRGYHKLSLKVHPDRVHGDGKKTATEKFQVLGKIYCILSDKDKRAVYDETGEVDDEDDVLTQDKDWYDYWRILFHQVTPQDIKEFEEKYKGSDEELSDLKDLYCEYEGDMSMIMDGVMCCTAEDEPRFIQILKDLIKKKEITEFKGFTRSITKTKIAERKRKADEEADEADEEAKKLGLGEEDEALKSLIHSNQQSRAKQMNSFFADLEAKYAEPEKKTKSKGKSKKK